MTSQTASCCCGQLRVVCEGPPMRVSLCHCLECQKRTGSLFGVAARYRIENVKFEGRAKSWSRRGDEGNLIEFHFCPECGSNVWWQIEAHPDIVAVAAGNFADPDFPMPMRSVYQHRRHPWLELPERIERI